MDELKFMPVNLSHIDLIYQWANEEETRKYAFHTEQIEYSTHQRWMREKLKDANCLFYICCNHAENIGLIRVDVLKEQGLISYSVDKRYRGRGYGKRMLHLLEQEITNHPKWNGNIKELLARVKYENLPSQRCFEKLGYKRMEFEQYIEYRKNIVGLVDSYDLYSCRCK